MWPLGLHAGVRLFEVQVEKQVGTVRGRFFISRLRFKSYEELNAWLLDKCIRHAKTHDHPELKEQTVWQMFEDERSSLVPYAGHFPACSRIAAKVGPVMPDLRSFAPADRDFDGFHGVPVSVSKTCLVRFDNNQYSVIASAADRASGLC